MSKRRSSHNRPGSKDLAPPAHGGLFPAWVEQALDAQAQSPIAGKPERLREMHRVHGSAPEGTRCGSGRRCQFLRGYQAGGRWYKCLRSHISSGAGTDWRVNWPACALYVERPDPDQPAAEAGA